MPKRIEPVGIPSVHGGEEVNNPEESAARSSTAKPPSAIRVAIIEDVREIREGLAALINGASGFQCVCAHRTFEEALRELPRKAPDIVLVDLGLPGMSGIEGIPPLKERLPTAPVIVLTVYDDDERIFAALCAGASGYLLKRTPPWQLLEAIRDALEGGSPISPEVARKVIRLFRELRPPQRADYDLTPHETRLLRMLSEGHNYKTAADELGVSVNTIGFHMRHIYEKLHVHSKSQAVAKALRSRLVH
jgi:DNA-binding NarL/FixJ family response regulator